jgi:hypothetical protein
MNSKIRSLTNSELESLEKVLGKPIEREYLVRWMTRSITDVVKFANQPSPRQFWDRLLRIERAGREWLSEIDATSRRFTV